MTVNTGGNMKPSWCRKGTLLAYCFADDVDALARTEAGLCYVR